MNKKGKNTLIFFFVIAIVLIILGHALGLFSLFNGNAEGARFIYFITYIPVNGQAHQLPATVTMNNQSCNTRLQPLNLGYSVAETDLPIPGSTGFPPLYQYYTSGSSPTNVSLCLITLPANTTGTTIKLLIRAQNSSTVYSQYYNVNLTVVQGSNPPVLFTVPLGSGSPTTSTTSTSTSTTAPSTSLLPGQSSSSSTTSTSTIGTATTIPQQPASGFLNSIWNWINGLIQDIERLF